MPSTKPRYSMDEFARRGDEIYAKIRPQVDQGNLDRIVAIDIETGEFALGDDTKSACDQLFARAPDAQIFCIRIGYRSVHQFGAQSGRIVE
jgi:hypothetical protein